MSLRKLRPTVTRSLSQSEFSAFCSCGISAILVVVDSVGWLDLVLAPSHLLATWLIRFSWSIVVCAGTLAA